MRYVIPHTSASHLHPKCFQTHFAQRYFTPGFYIRRTKRGLFVRFKILSSSEETMLDQITFLMSLKMRWLYLASRLWNLMSLVRFDTNWTSLLPFHDCDHFVIWWDDDLKHMMLINAINAINLWKNLEIDFKSCPSQELQTGHGSPSTRGAPQGLPAMIMIVGQ